MSVFKGAAAPPGDLPRAQESEAIQQHPGLAHPQAVRFSSVNQEIEPVHSLGTNSTVTADDPSSYEELSATAQAEIRSLSASLHTARLQQTNSRHFAFEPVSLPASRVPSNESSGFRVSREATKTTAISPRPSPHMSALQTPPLTPAGTSIHEGKQGIASGADLTKVPLAITQMTPQTSGPRSTPAFDTSEGIAERDSISSTAISRPPSGTDQRSSRATSLLQQPCTADNQGDYTTSASPKVSSGDTFPISREPSPRGTSAPGSGTATPPTAYNRPFTPAGDENDPYARSKRPPQTRNLDAIDARFVFGNKDVRRRSAFQPTAGTSLTSLPRSSSGNDLKSQNRHQSTFSLHSLGGKKDHLNQVQEDSSKHHSSMSELKRFFRFGQHKAKRAQSPSAQNKATVPRTGAKTPPHQLPVSNTPFADDHGLQTKYGKFGKVLGSGAGGSVRLLKRGSDGVTFAVKQFRDRHPYESERDYNKKVTAEFCIGSTLHHGNVIETLDIIHEKGHWYEIMEYAPFDLFAIVMTGRMSKAEIACSFLQIFAGVTYLHGMGLAHRDLKLDNVVVNERGIMKLIDFGSASVFRYPFENDIVLASGIVGSDPYLAPEVYDHSRYDPQPTDIWSLAIIFACMSLRRFPWKAPRITDNSYKLFISAPSPGTPISSDAVSRRSYEGTQEDGEPRRKSASNPDPTVLQEPGNQHHQHHHHHHHHPNGKPEIPDKITDSVLASPATSPGPRTGSSSRREETLKGPWRLLRLLPRETRAIMGKMLEIDPRKRATIADMMEDPWIIATPVCQEIDTNIINAPGHTHTLEPGTEVTPADNKK